MSIIKHGGVYGGPDGPVHKESDKLNPDRLGMELYPPPRFYIAGPFFNPTQVNIIEGIETLMCDHGVPFYSPRLTERNKKKELDDEDAREIFQDNVNQIMACGSVIAVLDWALPQGQELRLMEHPARDMTAGPLLLKSGRLNLPDAGTVWEMGFAYGKRPVYGFTLREPGEKVNIMLTQCLDGVLHGWPQLTAFLNRGRVRPGVATKGQWKHR